MSVSGFRFSGVPEPISNPLTVIDGHILVSSQGDQTYYSFGGFQYLSGRFLTFYISLVINETRLYIRIGHEINVMNFVIPFVKG